MTEVLIAGFDQTTMCRLCLSSGVPLLDLFSFSNNLKDRIANVIMKCAPIQIRRDDELPNSICQLCYTKLKSTRQFQMQIIKSEKTLQLYLKQLHALDKKAKLACSIDTPSDDPLSDNTNADITVKCEPSEFKDFNVNWKKKDFENFNSSSKINGTTALKSKIRNEQINDNSLNATDCTNHTLHTFSESDQKTHNIVDIIDSKMMENMNVNGKVEEPTNYNLPCKNFEEITIKSEIKDEPMDDLLIMTESIEDRVDDFSEGCEDTKIGFDYTSGNSACFRSSGVEEYFENFVEGKKSTSVDRVTYEEANKVKTQQIKIKDTCKKNSITRVLKTDKRACNSEKSHQCDVCNKCFTTPSSLNIHKRIHTGEKPYQCYDCKKCFTQSCQLKSHRLRHTGEKPYYCDDCAKSFTTSYGLNIHKLVHTGEKPYKCDVCKKCFTQSGHLKSHKLLHTGEKLYQCDVCNKCLTTSSNLKTHKVTHTVLL